MLLKYISKQLARRVHPASQAYITTARKNNMTFSGHFMFSEVEVTEGKTKNTKFMDRSPRNNRSEKKEGQRDGQSFERKTDLVGLLKGYRMRMEKGNYALFDYTYSCKQIANYYRKNLQAEFNDQKEQLEKMLDGLSRYKLADLPLAEYFNLLDFIRVAMNIETIQRSYRQAFKEKMIAQLKNYQPTLDLISIQQLMTLYCKITPLNHPDGFKVSSILHDKLVDIYNDGGDLKLSTIQCYVILKSISKKDYMSFVDKKIMEMFLITLKKRIRTIDDKMILWITIALKDCKIRANISDHSLLSIVDMIMSKAVKKIKHGAKFDEIQRFLLTSKTDNPYFKQIYEDIYFKTMEKIKGGQAKFFSFKVFCLVIPHLSSYYTFSSEDRQAIIKQIKMIIDKKDQKFDIKDFNVMILDVLRSGFFDSELNSFAQILKILREEAEIYWSFSIQYSYRKVAFPIELIEDKIKKSVRVFKRNSNFLKMAVTVAIQRQLYPQNVVLKECYDQIIKGLESKPWNLFDLESLYKISIHDSKLVQVFHQLYGNYYMKPLIPSQVNMIADNNLGRGKKSQLFKFWEYLVSVYSYDKEMPLDIVTYFPVYATYLSCHRTINLINTQPYIKPILLQALDHHLESGKIKFSDNEISLVLQLLSLYSPLLSQSTESVHEIYWSIIKKLINQYYMIRTTLLPNVNYLLMKLLTINDYHLKSSLYFKNFIVELIKDSNILSSDNNHSYFKTAIIREALHNNLLSENNLPQLDWDFYSPIEQQMLKAKTSNLNIEEWNSQAVAAYVNMPRPTAKIAEELLKLEEVIEKSSPEELQIYLIHYSMGRGGYSDKILTKIVEKYIPVLNVKKMDLLGVLMNIKVPLSKVSFKLFRQLLVTICGQLTLNPSTHLLADHLLILKILSNFEFSFSDYETALWVHAKNSQNGGAAAIDLMYELCRKTATFQKGDFSILENYFIRNPSKALRVLMLCLDQQNMKSLVSRLTKHISIPIKQSLYTLALDKKFGISLSKGKGDEPILQLCNKLAAAFLKSLEENGIPIKKQHISGQNIYLIQQKFQVVFAKLDKPREIKFIEETLLFLHPKRELILVSHNPNEKDLLALLDQLTNSEHKIVTEEIATKIKQGLQLI